MKAQGNLTKPHLKIFCTWSLPLAFARRIVARIVLTFALIAASFGPVLADEISDKMYQRLKEQVTRKVEVRNNKSLTSAQRKRKLEEIEKEIGVLRSNLGWQGEDPKVVDAKIAEWEGRAPAEKAEAKPEPVREPDYTDVEKSEITRLMKQISDAKKELDKLADKKSTLAGLLQKKIDRLNGRLAAIRKEASERSSGPKQKVIARRLGQKVTGRAKNTRNSQNTPRPGEGPWQLDGKTISESTRTKSGRDADAALFRLRRAFLRANTGWSRSSLNSYNSNRKAFLRRLLVPPFLAYRNEEQLDSAGKHLMKKIVAHVAKKGDRELEKLFRGLQLLRAPLDWGFLDGIGKVRLADLQAAYARAQIDMRKQLLTLKTPWSFSDDQRYASRLNVISETLVQTELKIVWILGYPPTDKGKLELFEAPRALEDLARAKFGDGEAKLKSLAQKWANYKVFEAWIEMHGNISLGEGTGDAIEELNAQLRKHRQVFNTERAEWEKFRQANLQAVQNLYLDRMERGLKILLKSGSTVRPHVRNAGRAAEIYRHAVYHMTGPYTKAGFFRNIDKPDVQKDLLLDDVEKANFEQQSKRRPKVNLR